METTKDKFLGGRLLINQPKIGYKSGVDAVLLASMVNFGLTNSVKKVLDIGTGVGVAGLCVASRLPNVNVYGLEKQEDIYNLAVQNSKDNILNNSSYIPFLGNILSYNFNETFDAIIMNPPYYTNKDNMHPTETKNIGNIESDATIKDFISFAFKNLKNLHNLYIIHRSERLKEVLDTLSSKHWGNIELYPVYSYVNNPAKRFIIKAKKLGKNITTLNYGIVMHNEDSSYTYHAKNILEQGKSFIIKGD